MNMLPVELTCVPLQVTLSIFIGISNKSILYQSFPSPFCFSLWILCNRWDKGSPSETSPTSFFIIGSHKYFIFSFLSTWRTNSIGIMTETTTSSQANDPIEVWLALSTNCVILNPLAYTRDVSGEHGSIMTIFHKNISAFPSIK